MRACLSEAVVADVLKKHFVVVSDPFSAQNGVSFGVHMWVFDADGKEMRSYWYGTGNCMIGGTFTAEYHNKHVRRMSQVLAEARQVHAGELRAARDSQAKIKSVDVEQKTLIVTSGRDAKEQHFKLGLHTRLLDGLDPRKEPVPLKDGLQSTLFAEGNSVRVWTTTHRDGSVIVSDVEVTGRDPFRKNKK